MTTSGFDSIASISEAEPQLLQTVPGLETDEAAHAVKTAAAAYLAEHGEVDIEALITAEREAAAAGEEATAEQEAEVATEEGAVAEQATEEVLAAPAVGTSGEDEADQKAE